ncbi:Hsp70 family protein [Ahrensia kielensis]|uniref:Hsp70 family protein n=1 Tax=Ahrensia kielensis TaxID=76980 RepID=A0ABU9T5R7_9HYPH
MNNLKQNTVLGIDFGTSNSAAGIAMNNKPVLLHVEEGEKTLPTSIFFDNKSKQVLYGREANAALVNREEGRFLRALKSVLGTTLMHERRYLMGQSVTFIDVIAQFLTEIKTRAENAAGQSFDYALSGRPVYFHSDDEKKNAQALTDLEACYEKAGFKGVSFMAEPEAAAIANGGVGIGEIALIVDIGGGTSDFCFFEGTANGINVLANNGIRIGGTDFDKTLNIDHVMPLLGFGGDIKKDMGAGTLTAPNHIFHDLATWEKIPALYSRDSLRFAEDLHKKAIDKKTFGRLIDVLELEHGHDIAFAVERAKIKSNETTEAFIDLDFIESQLNVPLNMANLDESLASYAEKISAAASETVKSADLDSNKIDKIIFVGGSSLMQIVKTKVTKQFPNIPILHADAFTAIVDGLALAAENRS